MKGAIYYGKQDVRIEELETPIAVMMILSLKIFMPVFVEQMWRFIHMDQI